MHPEKKIILFNLWYKNELYPIQVSRSEFRTLMNLISCHLAILSFGICTGVGRCGTCMVTICAQNERRSTLSCDVSINDELANANIIVSEGH